MTQDKERFLEKWKRRIKQVLEWVESKFISKPEADTFAEGQRSLMVKLLAGAGMFCGLFGIVLVLAVWLGNWDESQQQTQLYILGIALVLVMVGMLGVIRALAIGGPVGKQTMKLTKDGVEMSSEASAEMVEAALERGGGDG